MRAQLMNCLSWGHLRKLAVGIESVNHLASLGVKETSWRITIGDKSAIPLAMLRWSDF